MEVLPDYNPPKDPNSSGWIVSPVAIIFISMLVFAGGGVAAEESDPPPPPLETIEIGAVSAGTASLLLSGQSGGTVDGALVWSLAGRDENGRVRVPYVIEVDGRALLAGDRGRHLVIGIYAYVVDVEGNVVDYIAQGLILKSEEYRTPITSSGLKFVGVFDLDPGDFTLRVMVQNNASGLYFMSWSILDLPEIDDSSPILLPPLFRGPQSQWVVANQYGQNASFAVDDGTGIVPAARPTLVENRTAEIYLGGNGWDDNALVGVRIVNDIGRTVSEPLPQFTGQPVGEFQFRRVALSPIDLPPGDYSLIVTLTDEQATEVLRRASQLSVVGDGQTGGWASSADRAVVDGAASVAHPQELTKKLNKKQIRVAYRRALIPLGEGDYDATRREVSELERLAVAGGSRTLLLELSEAELAEAKALAKTDPTCLMPLALLHRDLYRGYTARRQGLLASHARKMAIAYAEQLGQDKPYFGFSEGLLVNFAADLAQAGGSAAARDLLEGALLLNPGYEPALLSLGFSFERDSEYLKASDVYQTLVDTHPDSDEGRLRLAVNLIRAGRPEAAERIFRELLQNGANPWIEALAAHELVRLKMAKTKDLPEAEREARSALQRMPDDQKLWILLAAILERSNRHDEAIEVLGNLPSASRGVSPRARYAEWPAMGIRASQAHLNRRAAEAIPALKAALAGRGGAS
jgi:tetratricopeptide (TPR) repeat protein